MPDDQSAVIEFLSQVSAYGLKDAVVQRCETHGAVVFLAGDRAYKLKRAVIFPYMDYSTVAKRHAMCEAELAVNHLLAPEIYIGVHPVICDGKGGFRIGASGEKTGAVDWLVVMHRFAQDAMLDALCERGGLTAELVRGLAERIASFHGKAEITPAHGGARGMDEVVEECVQIFRGMAEAPFEDSKVTRFANLARAALAELRPLLEARRNGGFVRRCHGDLHLGNICVIDGRPVPFDAIEFNDEFSCIDVLYDIAFLVMDLERRGLQSEANLLLNHYLRCTGDYQGLAALPLFLGCRAAIRAHVTIAAATLKDGKVSPAQAQTACAFLEQSIRYLEPMSADLIAVGGLSGTGKSTLAAGLAPAIGRCPGAIVVRTDILRKMLKGVPDEEKLPDEAYDPAFHRTVYDALDERCAIILKTGHSVIADGVFGRPEERANIERTAGTTGARFRGIWLQGPEAALEQRIEGRRHDASDATIAVLHRQIATVQVPAGWGIISAEGTPAEMVSRAMETLV